MKKRIILCFVTVTLLMPRICANAISWVDFRIGYAALERALTLDISSQGEEKTLNWIDILALAATRNGGRSPSVRDIDAAAEELRGDRAPKEFLGEQFRYYAYYREAYGAVLGGLVGNFAIEIENPATGEREWKATYGLKAFSPIAEGYDYCHYDDFGGSRTYGYARRHLGNDLLGVLGTPIVAVESGTVEALGWNQYGGWRIGIRSHDGLRYYYYAHLRKDTPYAAGLTVGSRVTAGEVIGFMGRTGYSVRENVNNIEIVHLHFGMELIFDGERKDPEIWVDVYSVVKLLSAHRSTVRYCADTGTWQRVYAYRDLDAD